MNGLYAAAREIQEFMNKRGWRFCTIGGLAVVRWGEPRATVDVDITLLTGFGDEKLFINELLGTFPARIKDAADFALRNRVLLLSASNGTPIDIALGGIPFEELIVQRASLFFLAPGIDLLTCSAEDLIVLKAFAGRPRDMNDVAGIVTRQKENLKWDYIFRQLGPLCDLKGDSETMKHLEHLQTLHERLPTPSSYQ